MRACPYCAEQIQDAAILCRFCGRDLPTTASQASAVIAPKPRLPTQRYAIDERIKRATTRVDPKRRPSLWAKIGGALDVLGPSELRPGRPGERGSMVREYASVRKYQADVDRLIPVGWLIDQQVDRPQKIVVRWVRGPAEGQS
ncbi:MAG: zinc ribbon domain-containing protein [Chloroflexota bacterium]|nr:zinc ribbon domain-containing protein [Chloroflexota bacterium]